MRVWLKRLSFMLILLSAILMAMVRVGFFYTPIARLSYPDRGDLDFYVNCTRYIPLDQPPVVPVLLFIFNLALANSILTVLSCMVFAYALIYYVMFQLAVTYTGSIIASVSMFFLVIYSDTTLSPTALKNLFGVAFILLILLLLPSFMEGKRKESFAFIALSILALFVHSATSFLLLPIYFVYSLKNLKNHRLLTVLGLFLIAVLLVSFTPLSSKGWVVLSDFVRDPLTVFINNLVFNSLIIEQFCYSTVLLSSIIMLLFLEHKELFISCAVVGLLCYFLPSVAYAGRMRETAMPFIGLLFAFEIKMLLTLCKRLLTLFKERKT